MKDGGTSPQRLPFLLDAIALDRGTGVPLSRQLYLQLRGAILERLLRPHTALPSTRALARDVSTSRNTVIAAYEQLASEGFIETRQGSRATVATLATSPEAHAPPKTPSAGERISARGQLMLNQPRQRSFPGRVAFHPGTPDVRQFPFGEWRRLIGRRLQAEGDDLFGYHHLTGYPALKEAIAGYLAVSRRVRCDPSQVVVTTGAQAALDLLARLLLDCGDGVWMEEPGYLGAQSAFLAAGARLLPLKVDESGWVLDPPSDPRLRLIYSTPSCHFPLGITMRIEQRLRILEIARQCNAWVVEDDFDSEYRFVGKPIPAMQGADPTDHTIYLGTFAKTLFPALRIGFMILPHSLSERISRALSITGQYPPLVLQAALADFLGKGLFTQHLGRMRRLYAKRRDLFIELGRFHLSKWLEPIACDAGIQTLWRLGEPLRDRNVAAAAEKQGLNVAPLSRHYHYSSPRNGLILGYAALDEAMMQAGLAGLGIVLAAEARKCGTI